MNVISYNYSLLYTKAYVYIEPWYKNKLAQPNECSYKYM